MKILIKESQFETLEGFFDGKKRIVVVDDWTESKKKLEKNFKFDSFEDAISFVNKVAKIAEKQNHHPDIQINYNKVKISITDHEKGGVSEKCHKFVNEVDKLLSTKKTEELQEKCWPGYEKKGMKTMFGKRYPNCVKKKK